MRQRIYATVKESRLDDYAELQLLAAIAANDDKRIIITIERGTKKRSLNQNAFFHGPFLDACYEMFIEAGNEMGVEMVKDVLKHKFGINHHILLPDGSRDVAAKSTAEYTTQEIEDFMDKVRAWAGAFGYDLPVPNENVYQLPGEKIGIRN